MRRRPWAGLGQGISGLENGLEGESASLLPIYPREGLGSARLNLGADFLGFLL